jgi:3-methylcrotonyl-CoA carboxylase alpha subunit
VRIDAGVRAGDAITPYYDPMIAKLIVRDRDRDAALARMREALEEVEIVGPETNVEFLMRLVQNSAFAGGRLDTGLIERERAALFPEAAAPGEDALALAALCVLLQTEAEARERALRSSDPFSPWSRTDSWRPNGGSRLALAFQEGAHHAAVTVRSGDAGHEIELRGRRRVLRGELTRDGKLIATLGEETVTGRVVRYAGVLHVFLPGRRHRLVLHDPLLQVLETEAPDGELFAPMPGKIVGVLVEPGGTVDKGTPLLILEAMKMEHTILAPARGKVTAVHYKPGDQVAEGAELLAFEPEAKRGAKS